MNAAAALHQAVYAALSSNLVIRMELGDPPRLYDDVPKGAAFPYVIVGEGRAKPLAGVDGAFEHELTIAIVSRHAGRAEVRRLIDALYDALHEASFPVSGHRLVGIRFVFADAVRRGENDLYRGAVRFRAVTEVL
jgi:hypothetical protein